jgi:hypothetical protein
MTTFLSSLPVLIVATILLLEFLAYYQASLKARPAYASTKIEMVRSE